MSKLRNIFTTFWKPAQNAGPSVTGCATFNRAVFLILNHIKTGVKGVSSFELKVQPSTIPDSGNGVFIDGRAQTGDVLALYPGVYKPPPPLWTINHIDGSPSSAVRIHEWAQLTGVHPAIDRGHTDSAYVIHCNRNGGYLDAVNGSYEFPLVVGHIINHPNDAKQVNVEAVDFLWRDVIESCSKDGTTQAPAQEQKDNIDSSLHNFIRSVNMIGEGFWYIDPDTQEVVTLSDNCAPCAGMAIVAKRPIKSGEELYMDYRYDPKSKSLPPWYKHLK